MKRMAAAGLLCSALSFTGCTTVHVHPIGDAAVKVSSHVGLARITLAPGERGAVIYSSRGVGAASTPTGFTFGAWRETTAVLAARSDCRAVLWIDDASQVAEVERLLRASGSSLTSVCVVNSGGDRP